MEKHIANDNWEASIKRAQRIILVNTFYFTAVSVTGAILMGNLFGLSIHSLILLILVTILVMNAFVPWQVGIHAHLIRIIHFEDNQIEITTSSFLWKKRQNVKVLKNELYVKEVVLSGYLGLGARSGLQIKKNNRVVGYLMDELFEEYNDIKNKLEKGLL